MKKNISVEELKMLQLKILDSIDDFCKKNEIQYFLFSGTLIGAVRHKGYIPWDDDVDICMKRKDYDRFFAEFNQQRQDTLKAISTETEKDYYLASGKVIDTATVIEEENNYAMPIGVYVDVFPMDYLPADDKKLKQLNHRIDIYRKMLVLKSVPVSDRRSTVKNWVLKVSSFLLKPISMQHLISKIAKLATSYNDDATCNRIADISVFTYGMNEVFPCEDFAEAVELEFEGKKYSAPKNYKHVLSNMYGDYMKLPPEEKQVSHHHFTAYWK